VQQVSDHESELESVKHQQGVYLTHVLAQPESGTCRGRGPDQQVSET